MNRAKKGLFDRRQALIFLFCTIHCMFGRCSSSCEFEIVDFTSGNLVNWNSAVTDHNDGDFLAKISTLDQLCDAKTYFRDPNREYWTALRLTGDGECQWGLNNSAIRENCSEVLEESQPGQCYVISKYPMKLQPRSCNSSKNVLYMFECDPGWQPNYKKYTYECAQYKISTCLQNVTSDSQWMVNVPYSWSCNTSEESAVGVCYLEMKAISCCDKYCNPANGNLTYSKNITYIGNNLTAKVGEVLHGFSEQWKIGFDDGDMVSLAPEVFKNTGRVIVVTLHRTREQDLNLTQDRLVSNVIGVALSPEYNKTFPHLINITFSHAKITKGKGERICVFWNEDNNSSIGSWSSEGCYLLDETSLERTVCSCNHLTSFAVLMQFDSSKKISKSDKLALSVITYVGCILSMTGELLLILIYVVFMKFKAEGIQIRINLAAALFWAQLVFMSGINATEEKPVCVLVAILLHYLFLVSFGWMLLEGVYLYIMVVEVFSSVKVWYLYVFAWGFPIIPVAISLGISSKDGGVLQNYTNENFCWLSFSKKLSWSFIVPVLIIILINVVILIAVLREIRNLKDPDPSKLRSFKKGFKACIILSPLLGLTWVFGLLAATNAGLVFQYIFTILNSAQGLFIFVLHVVRNSDVRAEIHHKLLRWRFQRSANRVHEKSSTSTCRCKQQQHGLEDCGNDTTVCQTSI
ncbi:adhesion G-protein coupled receptor D1-like isoform X2 [Montipora foliosa]|uniref:adhesion G-protein coupled receptor D1-like isoform X2 n=1 Tax=Montipora foliosa TaxID=591990 RepID=UPI0035F18E83